MNAATRRALIPMKNDTYEEVERLVSQMVPLIWLPREGVFTNPFMKN